MALYANLKVPMTYFGDYVWEITYGIGGLEDHIHGKLMDDYKVSEERQVVRNPTYQLLRCRLTLSDLLVTHTLSLSLSEPSELWLPVTKTIRFMLHDVDVPRPYILSARTIL